MEAGASKVPVGQIIAILAEEGDDLSSIEVPANLAPEGESSSQPAPAPAPAAKKEEAKEPAKTEAAAPKKEETTSSTPSHGQGHKTIKHPKPLFPSVSRL
jgi:pyruvate/2-oxoglutarate dehydrogenase complex dihydrolipoamide acyltransferase (E2) component